MGTRSDNQHGEDVTGMRQRLAELEDTLHAIRTGQVDALVHGHDIFTLESAESASNRFRGQVLEQISETVVALDNEERITYINEAAEAQYGLAATDVIGLPLSSLFTLMWMDPAEERASAAAIDAHGHWRGENIHVKHSGEVMHVETVVNALRGPDGERIGLLTVMRDVTQRVKDREALAESARQKDHFLATLAHELRNPLAPIMNGLQLFETDGDDAELMTTTRRMMQRQLDHLVRLVDDLMDMSRISRGKLELRTEDLDLEKVLNVALETSSHLIDRSGHRLEVQIGPGPFPVHGDTTRLAQIISNLLNNAAKYTPHGGAITVRLRKVEKHVELEVLDTGIGIAPDHIDRIFDMFTQVDASQSGAGGLGIGLNLSKRLALMHAGTLAAESRGKNKGSRFILRLPLSEYLPQAAEHSSTGQEVAEHLRVLVVDDNEDVANTTALVLSRLKVEAHAVYSGEEALARGAALQPHLVLMDLGMPSMSGHETCRHMRQEKWGRGVTIVAVSGWGQDGDRARSKEAGFDEHMVKPLELHSIKRLLGELAEGIPKDAG